MDILMSVFIVGSILCLMCLFLQHMLSFPHVIVLQTPAFPSVTSTSQAR